jgi:hypothetical protein
MTKKLNLLYKSVKWVHEVKDIQATLSKLDDGDRLDKALGLNDKNNSWESFAILSIQAESFRYVISCQMDFLGRF